MPASEAALLKREQQRYKKLSAICTGEDCYKLLDLYDINQRLAAGEDINCPNCKRSLWRT